MRKLILALTLMLSVVAVQAANYGINVGGVEVSTSNYYNVTGGQIKRGTVSYNPSTNTLTLNNVDISRTGSGNFALHNRSVSGLKVVFNSYCYLESEADHAIKLEKNTTFEINTYVSLTSCKNQPIQLGSINLTVLGKGKMEVETTQLTASGNTSPVFLASSGASVDLFGTDANNRLEVSFYSLHSYAVNNISMYCGNYCDIKIKSNSTAQNVYNTTFARSSRVELLEPYQAYFSNGSVYSSEGSPISNRDILISDNYALLINAANFPDANFRSGLYSIFGKGYLTNTMLEKSVLNLSGRNIQDFTGLKYFTKVRRLEISNNPITSIDLSSNNLIDTLFVDRTKLTILNLTNITPNLKFLFAANNPELTTLFCSNCQLTGELNLRNCPKLSVVTCSNNQITQFDLSDSKNITEMNFNDNQVTSFISWLNNLPKLKRLYAKNNKLSYLFNAYYGQEDFSHPELFELYLDGNPLGYNGTAYFTIKNCPKLGHLGLSNTNISRLECNDNALLSLNVSNCPYLKVLDAQNNQLSSVDVALCTALTHIYLQNNNLVSFNFGGQLPSLQMLFLQKNKLTSVNLVNCTALTYLDVSQNQLDLGGLVGSLQGLDWQLQGVGTLLACNKFDPSYPEGNKLYVGDGDIARRKNWIPKRYNGTEWVAYRGMVPLVWGYIPDDNFRTAVSVYDTDHDTYIDDPESDIVTEMNVSGKYINDLTGLKYFPNLLNLNCSNNNLTSLNVQQNYYLQKLNCSYNKIPDLFVGSNYDLVEVLCYQNELTSLYVRYLRKLRKLEAYSNNLTNLDVTGCDTLSYLNIRANQIGEEAMGALVGSMRSIPSNEIEGSFKVYGENTSYDKPEGNVITDSQISDARAKRWIPSHKVGNDWVELESTTPTYLIGDVNGDGKVDGTDLNVLINILLGKDTNDYDGRDNVNGEGDVDGNDLNALINILLGK